MSNNKARSSKPYDPNNSFVKKVASRVSGLIPRSTSWLSGWFSPAVASGQESSDRAEQLSNEEERFEDALEKPPPAKRFKVTTNQQYIDTYPRCQTIEQGEGSGRLVPNNFIDTSAIPGPSGLGSRGSGFVASTPAATSVGHLESKANGDDCSESGESTSGCSSLEPQINRGLPCVQNQPRQNDSISPRKHLLDDKLDYSYLQNSRSLYLDRTSNSRNNQTVGRRNNPSFCVNTFGTPLFGERGSVNDLILNSPFYSGRTTYGGASSASYRRSLGSASLSSSPANSEKLARHTIKVKPGNSQSTADTSMSQTAKRILATLEQFSTPILDAKRIPVAQEPVLANLGSRKRSRVDDSNTQLLLEQPRVPKRTSSKPLHWAKGAPSTSQLTIPAAPDTLIHRRREIVPELTTASLSSNVDSYQLRMDNEDNSSRNSLKMKQKPRLPSKVTKEPEMASEVNLPKVPLPISTLPSFDISVPAPKPDAPKSSSQAPTVTSLEPLSANKPVLSSRTATATLASMSSPTKLSTEGASADASFSFSSPISVSSASKEQPILSPVNDFTFSKPLPASVKFSEPSTYSVKARPKASNNSQEQSVIISGGLKPAFELKTGSVMDILGKGSNDASKNAVPSANGSLSLMDKFKPAAGTWECETCFIRNKSDVSKCAACSNPRETKSQSRGSEPIETKAASSITPALKAESSFGAQFKMAQGMWECSECMVRNKESDATCLSCTTPRPGTAAPKQATAATSFSGWGDKFKPASNTWECSVCMVRNGPELSACQSCTTKKPGASSNPPVQSSWGDKFKKPEGSWACSDCMVTNKSADLSCVACQAKKPGSETSTASPKPTSQFSFGVPPSAKDNSTTPAFSFGIPKETKETKEVEKANVSSSTGFKFGVSKTEASVAKFSFGVPPASTSAQAPSGTTAAPLSSSIFATSPTPKPLISATPMENKVTDVKAPQSSLPMENAKPTFSFSVSAAPEAKPAMPAMFSFAKPPASGVTSQPASSSGSPLGGKRKLGDDAPSSSAPPFKFDSGSNRSEVPQVKIGVTGTSSVSSTSGPVFSFSSPSASVSSTAGILLNPTVTSTANGQTVADVSKSAATNNIFGALNPASSSPASKPAFSFGLGVGASKDESVTSTWKPPTSNNAVNIDGTKPTTDSNGAAASQKPFTFGSSVSSSGMAFGSNANAATPTFSFGASAEKSANAKSASTPAVSFGSPASVPLFGAGTSTSVTPVPTFGASGNQAGFGTLTAPANPSPAFPTPVSGFGTPSGSAFAASFGASSDEKKPAFSFSAPEPKKSTGFAFSAQDVAKPTFSFGSSSDDSKKTAAFSFTTSSPANTTAANSFPSASTSVFTFGSAAAATNGPAKSESVFGTNQPPSFPSFNAQPATATSGFSFGAQTSTPAFAPANVGAPPTHTPTPTFGASSFSSSANLNAPFSTANQQQPSGVFSFGAQAPPAFNTNGGEKSYFTPGNIAPPQDGALGASRQRVIKKAARRNVR